MKIVIATPLYPPEIGGPATYSALLVRELPKLGYDLELVKFSDVRSLPKIVRHLIYIYLVYKKARRSDLVYALDPLSVGLAALIAAKLSRRPFIVRVAGDYAWEQGTQRFGVKDNLDEFVSKKRGYGLRVFIFKQLQTLVAKKAQLSIVPSFYLKGILEKWGVTDNKIKVIYSVFENGPLPLRDEAKKDVSATGLTILSAGRLVPWKGFDTLIQVVSEIKKTSREIKLRIAGSGPEEKELKEIIKQLGAESYVILLGELSRSDLYQELTAADLFVLNTSYEGLSHQLLEAIAAGTPIITTEVGGNPEIITSGENGVLVTPGRSEELSAAILWLANQRADRERLAQEAKKVLNKFSIQTMLQELTATLKNI